MRLTELLSPSTIRVPLEGSTKESLIAALVDLVYPSLEQAVRQEVHESVMRREGLMTTGIGNGIALPHGSAPAGEPLAVALGIPPQPVEFDAIDGNPVELVFLVLSTEQELAHKMRALARISRLLHREDFRRNLARAQSAIDAMRVIEEEEQRHVI